MIPPRASELLNALGSNTSRDWFQARKNGIAINVW